ncbi:MAG: gliding motility protein GldN [Bacteroidia bacterium]|nr:gliding motility protein GldN [Bacteroidia bacterium]
MKKLIVGLALALSAIPAFSQGVYDDFIYTRQAVTERKVIDWPYLREADVMWARRIWRVIDTREKQNQPMRWPKNPLNVILYNAIMSNKLIPYINDSLTSYRTAEEFKNFYAYKKPVTRLIDPNGDPDDPTNVIIDSVDVQMVPEDIKKYKIVEDWIFDKKESRMYVRIIAIGILVAPQREGVEVGEVDWAWLKYHKDVSDADLSDVREVLVNMEVFNRQNDAARLTYDDWFEQRLFSSYIIKEANPYDRAINEFEDFKDDKIAALLESERIKQELFEKEHDLWEY